MTHIYNHTRYLEFTPIGQIEFPEKEYVKYIEKPDKINLSRFKRNCLSLEKKFTKRTNSFIILFRVNRINVSSGFTRNNHYV